jgi:predicted nucleic acid-binding protein
MAASPYRPQLIAVDANVLFDLADGLDDMVDAVAIIRGRVQDARLLMPPTVQQELAIWVLRGDVEKRASARKAVQLSRSWSIIPASLIAVRHGIAERIAERVRGCGLLPEEEVNDSLLLAESALLGCSLLLTSDAHLRGMNFERLTLELQAFDVAAPVIATPREIVRKFFRR